MTTNVILSTALVLVSLLLLFIYLQPIKSSFDITVDPNEIPLNGLNSEGESYMNKFFDQIYVISLLDKIERWEKVSKQFESRKIKVQRFIAVDGRCKDQPTEACEAKLKSFEIAYGIKISNKENLPLNELLPASSLTIGTIMILRHMVKHKLEHILICEDDIELDYNIEKKFKDGIDEINKTQYKNKWDILYVGCGNRCGDKDISRDKSARVSNMSTLSQFRDYQFYVHHKNDLRMPCEDGCKEVTSNISIPEHASGSWCYAFSLKGAKKLLNLIADDAGNHVDQIYQNLPNHGGIVALAFNPPIVWHEEGAIRKDTDIPWKY